MTKRKQIESPPLFVHSTFTPDLLLRLPWCRRQWNLKLDPKRSRTLLSPRIAAVFSGRCRRCRRCIIIRAGSDGSALTRRWRCARLLVPSMILTIVATAATNSNEPPRERSLFHPRWQSLALPKLFPCRTIHYFGVCVINLRRIACTRLRWCPPLQVGGRVSRQRYQVSFPLRIRLRLMALSGHRAIKSMLR